MKDLKTYIKELQSLDEIVDTKIEDGVTICMYSDYVFDDIDDDLMSLFLFEGGSIYKGCVETARIIAAHIDKNFKKYKKSFHLTFTKPMFKNIDNIYFDTLYIKVNVVNGDICDAEFKTDLNSLFYDPQNQKFVNISIEVNIGKDFYNKFDTCVGIIAHELRHGHQELGYHNRGTSIIKSRIKLRKKFNKSEFKGEITHYINKDECEAYLAQLDAEIQDRMFSDIQQAVKWLNKYSDVWNNYKGLVDYINNANDKQLYIQFKKSWGKFINHVGHILNKHIEDQSVKEHAYMRFDHLLKNRQNERQIIESIEPEIQF